MLKKLRLRNGEVLVSVYSSMMLASIMTLLSLVLVFFAAVEHGHIGWPQAVLTVIWLLLTIAQLVHLAMLMDDYLDKITKSAKGVLAVLVVYDVAIVIVTIYLLL